MAINELGTTSYYYQLSNDIDLTEQIATNGALIQSLENGTIDGNEHKITIKNDNSEEIVALFNNFVESTLKNVTIEMDGKDITIAMGYVNDSHVYDAVFDNVTTTGTVEFTDRNCGLYVIYAGLGSTSDTAEITFINCTNEANIYGQGEQTRYNAVFVGYAWGSIELNFENCANEGLLYCGKAALFLGNQSSKNHIVTLNIENFENSGLVLSFYQGSNYTQNDYIAAAAGDSQVITVDGVTKTLSDDLFTNVGQVSSNSNMQVEYNNYGTFTITSEASNAETYKITYATYVNWWKLNDAGTHYTFAGTQIVYIVEEISKDDFVDGKYTTELKWLNLATSGMKDSASETSSICGYDTVTIDGETYYLIEDSESERFNKQSNSNSPIEKDNLEESTIEASKDINVVAYDANGHLVAGTYYKIS